MAFEIDLRVVGELAEFLLVKAGFVLAYASLVLLLSLAKTKLDLRLALLVDSRREEILFFFEIKFDDLRLFV